MFADVVTVTVKELKEIMNMRENRRGMLLVIFIPVILLGIQFPLQFKAYWVKTPLSLMPWVLGPVIYIANSIADSVAGERERHTLETIFATRLSEKALILGKIAASMIFALSITCLIVLIGGISSAFATGADSLRLLHPSRSVVGPLIGILTASLMANVGILVSLRAVTVRQAQQTLGIVMFVLFFSPSIIAVAIPKSILKSIKVHIMSYDPFMAGLIVFLFFTVVDIALFACALTRFKRNRILAGSDN